MRGGIGLQDLVGHLNKDQVNSPLRNSASEMQYPTVRAILNLFASKAAADDRFAFSIA